MKTMDEREKMGANSGSGANLGTDDIAGAAENVMKVAEQAIRRMRHEISGEVVAAGVHLLSSPNDRLLIATAVGKSSAVAAKWAGNMRSLGRSAFFVQSYEALHGDMGVLDDKPVVLAISNSGETTEVVNLARVAKSRGCSVIAITGQSDSTLGECSDVEFCAHLAIEGEPMGVCPTTSTTVATVLCDALVAGYISAMNLELAAFTRNHPGGALGAKYG